MNFLFGCSVSAFTILFLGNCAQAQEHSQLFDEIIQAHKIVNARVFRDVTVNVDWAMQDAGTTKKIEEKVEAIYWNDSRMMTNKKGTMATNTDYRFMIDPSGESIQYLEGKRKANKSAEALESELASMAMMSLRFDAHMIVDMLRDPLFSVNSVEKADGIVSLSGKWSYGDDSFTISRLSLDADNFYQLTQCEYYIDRAVERVHVIDTCKYSGTQFADTEIELLVNLIHKVSVSDHKEGAKQIPVFSNDVSFAGWGRVPDDVAAKAFKLSGHGFPEPDLDALNGDKLSYSPLIVVTVFLIGLVLVIYGKKALGKR